MSDPRDTFPGRMGTFDEVTESANRKLAEIGLAVAAGSTEFGAVLTGQSYPFPERMGFCAARPGDMPATEQPAPKPPRSPQEIEKEAERIRKEIGDRKSSYAAAIEVAELAELVRDLAHHLVKKG